MSLKYLKSTIFSTVSRNFFNTVDFQLSTKFSYKKKLHYRPCNPGIWIAFLIHQEKMKKNEMFLQILHHSFNFKRNYPIVDVV